MLDPGNVSSDVFDGNGVFDGETVGLTFCTRSVDEDSSIGSET